MAEKSGPEQIDDIIYNLDGWKAEVLTQVRGLILQADPEVLEEIKWKMPSMPEGRPVWTHSGNLILAEVFTNDIKIVFFKGALIQDPQGLFNARLKSNQERAIEFREDSREIDVSSFKNLVTQAVELNLASKK